MMCAHAQNQGPIKEPNVSGQFYPNDPKKLSLQIDAFLRLADVDPFKEKIEIMVSPHAGYLYSGAVAAYGYKAASEQQFKTIVVIAPSHVARFSGVSIFSEGQFRTPLGLIDVDQDFAKQLLARHEQFNDVPQVFEKEHALEVQIPFLQKSFNDFRIVPIVMGHPSFEVCEQLAYALNEIIGTRQDVLVVLSTDMSHYHNAQVANAMDHQAIALIERLDAQGFWNECIEQKIELCGFAPVTTGLLLAQQRGLQVKILTYADSGDVSKDKSAVVGYFSAVFFKESFQDIDSENVGDAMMKKDKTVLLSQAHKKRLLEIARSTIAMHVTSGKKMDVQESDPRLSFEEGAFVTIHKNGQLRGCIGNVLGQGPLYRTVRDMAVASTSQDPRFSPVSPHELDHLEIEVSVLSKPWKIKDPKEIELGVHGVIVKKGLFHQGLFLPQVATEQGWNREQLLSYLCQHKAGLPADAWKDSSVTLEIFTAQVFSEKDL